MKKDRKKRAGAGIDLNIIDIVHSFLVNDGSLDSVYGSAQILYPIYTFLNSIKIWRFKTATLN